MRKNFEEFDLQEAMRLAQSDAGRQLMAMLQNKHSSQMQNAIRSANAGDIDAVRQALADFLANPQAQALMRQLQEEQYE